MVISLTASAGTEWEAGFWNIPAWEDKMQQVDGRRGEAKTVKRKWVRYLWVHFLPPCLELQEKRAALLRQFRDSFPYFPRGQSDWEPRGLRTLENARPAGLRGHWVQFFLVAGGLIHFLGCSLRSGLAFALWSPNSGYCPGVSGWQMGDRWVPVRPEEETRKGHMPPPCWGRSGMRVSGPKD